MTPLAPGLHLDDGLDELHEHNRLTKRREQPEHIGGPPHEAVELLGPLDDDAERLLEVDPVGVDDGKQRPSCG